MIIHAANIHTGGGKGLLLEIINSQSCINSEITLILDQRFEPDFQFPKTFQVYRFSPTIRGRFSAELCLLRLSLKTKDRVLCFGNLPPLFSRIVKADLFFQNVIMLKIHSNYGFSWRTKIKHFLERQWLKLGITNIQRIFVQSNATKAAVLDEYPRAQVLVVPFIGKLESFEGVVEQKEFDFIYVSSGDPHKNHLNLFRAWELLASEGLYPALVLTVASSYQEIINRIGELQSKGIKVTNFPGLAHQKVIDLYSQSKALIFPSFCESFGMPLLEAQMMNLPIVASELDYVREFVEPVQTFDPRSPVSIARAVKRHLRIESKKEKVLSADEFIQQIST